MQPMAKALHKLQIPAMVILDCAVGWGSKASR